VSPAGGEPYLSLVVTARNDDHGGNLIGRMQAFVGGWIEQARIHGIDSELIVVEWNPPPDRPPLAEALRWPRDFGPCRVRIIEVPAEVHRRYGHAEALPLYQMIAKNAGIRRARGRFVLATNIDILFSSELAACFARRQLAPGRMYRIDRHDAMSGVPAGAPVAEQLEYCRTHLIRINTREGTFNVTPDGRPVLAPGDIAKPESGLLFGRGWLPVELSIEQEPFRWVGQRAELVLDRPPAEPSVLLVELEPGPGTGGQALDLEVAADQQGVLARVTVNRRSRLRVPLPSPAPARLWFNVRRPGEPMARDPRILNFRAFAFAWERGAGRGPSVRPVRAGRRMAALWHKAQYLVNKLGKGGPLVTFTVPVGPRLRRALKAYLDWNGFTGMLRHAPAGFRRRQQFVRRVPVGSDVFAEGSALLCGAGWRMLEDYRGESFRRARSGAEIVAPPHAVLLELGLQVEPGVPIDLALADGAGRVLARRPVEGLSFVAFPVPPAGGHTRVFRLEWDAPVEMKVFWCGPAGGAGAKPDSGLTQPWGAGWQWDADAACVSAGGAAELVVRASEQGTGPLFLDLETSAPLDFHLTGAGGQALAAFPVDGRALRRLLLPLAPGRTHVLSLSASGPFHARWCGWTETPAPGATGGRTGVPVFLHTNACGDFTLLARENWFDLRGYPEFDLFSMNIDSVFCIAAHHGGAPECVLEEPMRIYHIEHGTGSGWTPEGQARLFERIAARGLSFVDNEDLQVWAAQMNQLQSPMIFNRAGWGLEGLTLKETVRPAT